MSVPRVKHVAQTCAFQVCGLSIAPFLLLALSVCGQTPLPQRAAQPFCKAQLCAASVKQRAAGVDASRADPSGRVNECGAADGAESCSIPELVGLLRERNPDLKAARQQLAQAEGKLKQAGIIPNPSLDLQGGTDAPLTHDGEYALSASITQPIETAGKRGKRMRVARWLVEAARAQAQDAERTLTAQLQSLAGQALATQRRLQLMDDVDHLNQQMVSVMEVRLRTGDASKLDQSLLLANTNQVRAQRLAVQNELASLLIQIKTLAGMNPADPLQLTGNLNPPALPLTEAEALDQALQHRPDLRAARLEEQMAAAGLALSRAEAVPDITASLSFERDKSVFQHVLFQPGNFLQELNSLLAAGVSIPLPFFDRNQGNIRAAAAAQAQARFHRESLERQVRQDVALAFQHYQAARQSLAVYRGSVLPESRESLQIIRASYQLGEMRLLDVITQQRLLINAETSYTTAQNDYYQSLVDVERAIGRTLP
ncbi:MAG: TolC family protein [Terriglobia bacterium]